MIKFLVDENHLLLSYHPESDPSWLIERLSDGKSITLERTFRLQAEDLRPPRGHEELRASEPEDEYVFHVGELSGDYFQISDRVLDTKNTFYFHKDMSLSQRHFIASRGISILRKIDNLVSEDVYVGGQRKDAMPENAYADLVDRFPNSYELKRYADARVEASLRDYFESVSDTERIFQKYVNKKVASSRGTVLAALRPSELAKFETLLEKLETMLQGEAGYSERRWQIEILEMIRLIYPKYICAFKDVKIRDSGGETNRFLDFMLVDSCGSIDLIEIKKPLDTCLVAKNPYRDNYIPTRELSGAIMQLEKYIFYLNKWGRRGEDQLNSRYKDELPEGLRLKIINPKGMIIMGRENNLSEAQRNDFEVIKRKYRNVMDIVAYDDLLARLKFTISQLQMVDD